MPAKEEQVMVPASEHDVKRCLEKLDSTEALRELLTNTLGYTYQDEPLPNNLWPEQAQQALAEPMRVVAAHGDFTIFYGHLNSSHLSLTVERAIVTKLTHDYAGLLAVFSNKDQTNWHFVNPAKDIGKGSRLLLRRIQRIPGDRLRTASEQLAKVAVHGIPDSDLLRVVELHQRAFDVEEVTDRFYKSFDEQFNRLKDYVQKQDVDQQTAHQFAHALMNRMMFLYFVQRKGWLDRGNQHFLIDFWKKYKKALKAKGVLPDTFYRYWLSELLFSALNNNRVSDTCTLPKELRKLFNSPDTPFLNGGLFMRRDFDNQGLNVADNIIAGIYNNVLERYNFTIAEDTPLDQNVAVDPEMLGIVYESLVNTSELTDERAAAGIFYTPRVEVDFMCRRSLVEYLDRYTSANREDIYRFVFPGELEHVFPEFDRKVLGELDGALLNVTVVDPACGSAAFLVGMMQVILELRREVLQQLGKRFNEFEERRKIIQRSLYGVDVKAWAINIAKLRLWLTLIEVADEKELDLEAMKLANEPLLPSLSFKLRVGDSLVQEIAGTTIPIRSAKGAMSPAMQRKVTSLKKAKTDFYFNRGAVSEQDVHRKELELYQSIVKDRIDGIDRQIVDLGKPQKAKFQEELTAILKTEEERQRDLDEYKYGKASLIKDLKDKLLEEKAGLLNILENLDKKEHLFWSIEFAEIFQEHGGFDIVIGNPPYVRKEKIADPKLIETDIEPTKEQKREYKDRLARMVEDDWGAGTVSIGKRADLYVYFYLKGLSLLNPQGAFCFITSNSWLDVGYGASFQEFLLKHARVLAIYDNEVKRSFKRADVNTIIAVLSPRQDGTQEAAEHLTRFVMFKQPYEVVVTSDVLLASATTTERQLISTGADTEPQARVVAMSQGDLYRAGTESSDARMELANEPFTGRYIGNKWGGKYLRAPDVIQSILARCAGHMRPLSYYAIVEGYIHGNNVGDRYPKVDFIENIDKAEKIILVRDSLGVTQYGVTPQGNSRKLADLLYPRMVSDRFLVLLVKDCVYGQKFYKVIAKNPDHKELIAVLCNSTIGIIFNEIIGNVPWGQGALSVNGPDVEMFPLVASVVTSTAERERLLSAFEQLAQRQVKSIFEELGLRKPNKDFSNTRLEDVSMDKVLPDRRVLDNIIFDILGLKENEREEIYRAVVELISNRLKKARSV